MNEELKLLAEKYVCHYHVMTENELQTISKENITFNTYCGVTDICKDGKRVGKAFPKNGTLRFKWF